MAWPSARVHELAARLPPVVPSDAPTVSDFAAGLKPAAPPRRRATNQQASAAAPAALPAAGPPLS